DAARSIAALPEDVAELRQQGGLQKIYGIGPSLAKKIEEYLDTGKLAFFEELTQQYPIEATGLLNVPGVGPARAQLLHEKLGIKSVDELVQAAREHKLRGIPGF